MIRFSPDDFVLCADRPVPIVLDTDTFNEIDDQFAVIYALLAKDKVEVRGITAAPFFNENSSGPADGMERSYREIVKITRLLGMEGQVPVRRGAENFITPEGRPVDSEAAQLIISEAEAARGRGEKLFVCAIAAITNVASALLLRPDIAGDLVVVWLGGNERSEPEPREFNLQGDVQASRVIFESGCHFIQYPCFRVVSELVCHLDFLKEELKDCGEVGKYLIDIFTGHLRKHGNGDLSRGKVIWDIVTIAFFCVPEATKWRIAPRPHLGEDFVYTDDPANPKRMKIATKIDREMILRDLFGRIRRFCKAK